MSSRSREDNEPNRLLATKNDSRARPGNNGRRDAESFDSEFGGNNDRVKGKNEDRKPSTTFSNLIKEEEQAMLLELLEIESIASVEERASTEGKVLVDDSEDRNVPIPSGQPSSGKKKRSEPGHITGAKTKSSFKAVSKPPKTPRRMLINEESDADFKEKINEGTRLSQPTSSIASFGANQSVSSARKPDVSMTYRRNVKKLNEPKHTKVVSPSVRALETGKVGRVVSTLDPPSKKADKKKKRKTRFFNFTKKRKN